MTPLSKIAISGKGGVGKTSLSALLAHIYAERVLHEPYTPVNSRVRLYRTFMLSEVYIVRLADGILAMGKQANTGGSLWEPRE